MTPRIIDMMLGDGPKPDEVLRYTAIVLKVVATQDGQTAQTEHSTLALAEAFAFFTDNPDICAYMTVWGQGPNKEVGEYVTKGLAQLRREAKPGEWEQILADGRAASKRIFNVESATYGPQPIEDCDCGSAMLPHPHPAKDHDRLVSEELRSFRAEQRIEGVLRDSK